jgi:hypothetical protein
MRQPGWHLANNGGKFDTTLPSESFTVLHLDRGQIPEIRAAYPNALILVRHYLENWYRDDAIQVAQAIAEWYKDVRSYTKHITYANEQNLSAEGHPFNDLYPPALLYEKVRDWNTTVLQNLRQLCPDAVIHFPALSQGHSDDQNDAGYVGFEVLRKCVEAHDFLDIHTYWNGSQNRTDPFYGRRYEKLHALFPKMRLFISECNSDVDVAADNGAGIAIWYAGLPSYIEGTALFIWDSYDNQKVWILKNKPNILNAMRNFKPIPVPPQPPPDYSAIANAQYPAKDVRAIGVAALVLKLGFKQPDVAVAVCLAESSGNPQAIGTNIGSVDLGLWQINSKWHPEVSEAAAFNPLASTMHAFKISKGGTDYGAWSAYKQGTYRQYLSLAQIALAQLGR